MRLRKILRKALYRGGQVWLRLTAFARPMDYDTVEEILGPGLMPLFRRMPRSEQLHCFNVMQTLREQGHTHPDLLKAALLHDVGKSRYPFSLVGRVLTVLVRKTAPRRYYYFSLHAPEGWRRPFAIAEQHPEWSAQDMQAHGAPPLAVELARRHANKPAPSPPQNEADRLLALLIVADDLN